jgi:ABC-type phosphate/phosphonate transport system substrate-binding protein
MTRLDGTQVLAAVYERRVDVGVVSDYVADLGAFSLIDADAFRVIARTKGIPFITFAVAERVPQARREGLRDALLGITGGNVPAGLESTGFVRPMPWSPRFDEMP